MDNQDILHTFPGSPNLAEIMTTNIKVVPRGAGFQTVVTVTEGNHYITGRCLPRIHSCQVGAWNAGMEEARRLVDRMVEEKNRKQGLLTSLADFTIPGEPGDLADKTGCCFGSGA